MCENRFLLAEGEGGGGGGGVCACVLTFACTQFGETVGALVCVWMSALAGARS